MKKVTFLSYSLLAGYFLTSLALPGPSDAAHELIGVKGCAPCHRTEKQGKQVPIWQETKHAKAFQTLKTAEAAQVAAKVGVKGPAHEAQECLGCHVMEAHKTTAKAAFSKEEGVQCESCHGAGSSYKTMAIMKDRAKAVAAGMIPVLVSDGSAEKQCKSCHNPKSPTFKGFDFKTEWPKIAHPKGT
jgi:excinuclease UvrABC ATPase subunit